MSYAYQPEVSENDKRRGLMDAERDLVILQADYKKILREKDILGFECKRIENQIKQLQLQLGEKIEKKKKMEKEEYYIQDEISKVKKRRNSLV
ncbi:MAG: hypothetical protein EOM19_00980 [Candidatus Moranbacteria bacterium]|nr:hypothetical protein [Candidatus Moranbacteria bacterium]